MRIHQVILTLLLINTPCSYAGPDTENAQQSSADYSAWGGAITQDQSTTLWDIQSQSYFGEREIIEREQQNIIRIHAPSRAENDALVPVRIETNLPKDSKDKINKLYLSIDVNPAPMAGIFSLSSDRNLEGLETRVRVNGYTYIRAIAEMSDGKLYMDKQWVKSRGAGCSAPPGKNQEEHQKQLGKMRFKVMDQSTQTASKFVQLMISHPNNTGMQKDQLTTQFIPQNFIKKIEVLFDKKQVLKADTTFSLSENPSFRFRFDGDETGELIAIAKDSEDNIFMHKQQIGTNLTAK